MATNSLCPARTVGLRMQELGAASRKRDRAGERTASSAGLGDQGREADPARPGELQEVPV